MIELRNVSYIINENGVDKVILKNISCSFEKGCVTAITGHNGSGKSTLLRLIMGLIQPTKGEIFFNGRNITTLSIDERARMGLNYAFQQPVLFKGITVKELIDIATGENNSIPKVCEYLSRVGLCAKEYVDRVFDSSLSGGEQKRIELAISLAKKGKCYIFDEPEAGIDMWSFDKIKEFFKKGETYIVVSHQEKLLKSSDKLLVLENGEIVSFGATKSTLSKVKKYTCTKIGGGTNASR